MTRLEEINARMKAIESEIDNADASALEALNAEVESLTAERNAIANKMELRNKVASGSVVVAVEQKNNAEVESRAAQFARTGRMTVDSAEARSILVSGGTLATPTGVEGINNIMGAHYSSIVDFAKVVNCVGMGSNKVAYVSADANAAASQTEGSTASAVEPTFGYVTISPTSILALSQISKQAKKQSPLMYEAKVKEQALISLRKKAAALATAAMKASSLNDTVSATVSSSKGVLDQYTLRKLALNYGDDEAVCGSAVLFLNKTDLVAFGDVRGTNEKKPVYEIEPDSANPNTGIIRDGGLSVRYCINSGLTACSGTSQTSSAIKTMFYGDPKCLEIDLFSDYEIRVSEDFAFDKLLDTIRGDAELGSDVVVKHGFVCLQIPANG